jgi:hypothetical protein
LVVEPLESIVPAPAIARERTERFSCSLGTYMRTHACLSGGRNKKKEGFVVQKIYRQIVLGGRASVVVARENGRESTYEKNCPSVVDTSDSVRR